MLSAGTGFELEINSEKKNGTNTIEFTLNPKMNDVGSEGYYLNITPDSISIQAPQPVGHFYAIQTLLQLLPPQILRRKKVSGITWNIPCVQIKDYPRFQWRGAMLDVSRHFMPFTFIKKFIDLLSMHKLNTFHWHLTDDQGWRIEIKKYPKLTSVGARREETVVGHSREKPLQFDGKPHGGYYTQDTIQEIVKYAQERHITIVPEIEMPGHIQAAIAAYPELGNTSEVLKVRTTWGISKDILNVNENTIRFMQDVLTEVMNLFPSKFIHIGGDEVDKEHWKQSMDAQARIKELGLKNEDELQSYFIKRIDSFLTENNRRLIGWDEILEGGLAPGATVMSWRDFEGGIQAAKAGHDVVMAPNQWTYLNYYQTEAKDSVPLAIGGYLPLEKVYAFEPIPEVLSPDEASHILGAQGQLWTEYIHNGKLVEYMAFPRLSALAEVVWTPPEVKDFLDYQERLRVHLERLKIMDVKYHT
jgi:hexosaminidase